MLAAVLVLGLAFVGCKNEPDNTTKFEGRWVNLDATAYYGFTDFSYTFTGNDFTFRSAGSENSTMSGTFTFTDTTISFNAGTDGSWTQGYALNGNVLQLANDGRHNFGSFTKQ